MAATVTLSSLRTQARQRADMVNSQFITDSELNSFINNSIAELHDILIQAYGEDYMLSSFPFSTVKGTDSYDLPADFYKLRGVDAKIISNEWATLEKFNFNERNNYQNLTGWSNLTTKGVRYRLWGSQIKFSPTPTAVHDVMLWYYPVATELSDDDDTVDGIQGWEEYVIVDACIKMLQKQEDDVSVFLAQKQALKKRIEEAAENRDTGDSDTISDVYSQLDDPDREIF